MPLSFNGLKPTNMDRIHKRTQSSLVSPTKKLHFHKRRRSESTLSVALSGYRMAYRELKFRMEQRPGVVPPNSPDELHWFLSPNSSESALWQRLLSIPLLVSDDELLKLIPTLELSTTSSPPVTDKSTTRFYIRSISMRAQLLVEILRKLSSFYQELPRVQEWLRICACFPRSTVHVRYAGVCFGKTAFKRAMETHTSGGSGNGGLADRFWQLLRDDYPLLLHDLRVFEIREARLDGSWQNTYMINQREQTVIALIGPGSLNTQDGGVGLIQRFSYEESVAFHQLQTSLVPKVLALDHPSRLTTSGVESYGRMIQTYAADHFETTNGAKYPFTDSIREQLVRAATPQLINGFTPLLFIASDPPVKSFNNLPDFLAGTCDTSELVVRVLNQLANWEAGSFAGSFANIMSKKNLTPFIDMYPWPKRNANDLPFLLERHQAYVAETRPLVVVSFSGKVTDIVRHGFQEIKSRVIELFDHSGEPQLSSVGDHFYITVPCYHPGALSHRNSDIQAHFSHAFTLSMIKAWLALDLTLKELTEPNLTRTSKNICENVLHRMKSLSGEGTAFYTYLINARRAFREASSTTVRLVQPNAPHPRKRKVALNALPRKTFGKLRKRTFKLGRGPDMKVAIQALAARPLASETPVFLFSAFIEENYFKASITKGARKANIDLGDPSLYKDSVWNKLAAFCKHPRYSLHPAMGWLTEKLATWEEPWVRQNNVLKAAAVTMMIQALYPGCKETIKNKHSQEQLKTLTIDVPTHVILLEAPQKRKRGLLRVHLLRWTSVTRSQQVSGSGPREIRKFVKKAGVPVRRAIL